MAAWADQYWASLAASALTTSFVAAYAWIRLGRGIATWFVTSASAWALLAFLFASLGPESDALLWAQLRMTAVACCPALLFLGVLEVTGYQPASNRWLLVLVAAPPAVTIAVVWLRFDLVFASTEFVSMGGVRTLRATFGPWFWVHLTISYVFTLGAIVLLCAWVATTLKRYRAQTAALAAVALLPLNANVLATLGPLGGLPRADWTAASFWIATPAWLWLLNRYGRPGLGSIARGLLPDHMVDAVAVLDAGGNVVESNAIFRRVDRGTVGGGLTSILLAAGGEHDGTAREEYECVVEVDGQMRHFDVRLSPILIGADLVGRLLVARDVTERARMVDELEAYDRMVAHDLRSPLIGALSHLELAVRRARRTGAEPGEEIVGAQESCQKTLDVIDAHLRLARAHRAGQIHQAEVDMARVVRSCLAQLAAEIAERHATIVAPESWPPAFGDEHLIEQVWVNCISNALRHGGDPPRVEIGGALDEAGHARFWVRDNGPGLDDEQRATLLTHPARVVSARGGHGIGMTIVMRIVERLGGSFGVDANADSGCTFHFTLPVGGQAE